MLTTAKLEIPVEAWASLWIITSLLSLPCSRSALMSESQCAGQTLSITCGGPDFMIHVLYESYSYNPQDTASSCNKIATDTQCSNAEFLNPLSIGHCNGHSMCSFEVPGDKHISSCDKNNTAVKVYYSCISRNQVFDICSNFIFTNNQQLYLVTPNFPNNILQQNQCSCTVIGQNINATVLQHVKQSGSKVIMTMSTDKGTMHVNGIKVLNTILFTQVQKIELSLVNGLSDQIFKLWIGLTGTGMSLKCGTDGPPQWSSRRGISPTPVLSSTVHIATEPDHTSAITTSDLNTQSVTHIPQDTSQTEVVMPSYRTDITHSNYKQSLLAEISHNPSSCLLDISVSGAPCVHNDLQTISLTSQHTSYTSFINNFSSKQKVTDLISDIQMSPFSQQLSSKDNMATEISKIKNSFMSDKESLSSNSDEISNSISDLHQTESYTMATASQREITLSSLSTHLSSSILPEDERNSTQEKPTDSDTSSQTAVIAVLSCLAVIFFLSLVIAVVYFYWRKNNGKKYQMQNDEIYDAYNDNPALEPEPIVAGPRPLNGQPAGNLLLFLMYVFL